MNEHNHEGKGGCCSSESKGGCCCGKGLVVKILVALLLVGLGFALAKGSIQKNSSAPVQMHQQ